VVPTVSFPFLKSGIHCSLVPVAPETNKMIAMKTTKKLTCLLMLMFALNNTKAQTEAAGSKITITNFNVYENNDQLFINWQTDGVVDANYWQVQRSTDGKNYATIAFVLGADPRQAANHYQYKVKMRKRGESKLFYRLSPVDKNDKEISTEIISATK
jgi:hypothetical protein